MPNMAKVTKGDKLEKSEKLIFLIEAKGRVSVKDGYHLRKPLNY